MERIVDQPALASGLRLSQGHPIRRALVRQKPPTPATLPVAREGDDDVKLFALSFTAFFICIYTLIF